jgi:hypothetical protein
MIQRSCRQNLPLNAEEDMHGYSTVLKKFQKCHIIFRTWMPGQQIYLKWYTSLYLPYGFGDLHSPSQLLLILNQEIEICESAGDPLAYLDKKLESIPRNPSRSDFDGELDCRGEQQWRRRGGGSTGGDGHHWVRVVRCDGADRHRSFRGEVGDRWHRLSCGWPAVPEERAC